jgi:hypothetical protein
LHIVPYVYMNGHTSSYTSRKVTYEDRIGDHLSACFHARWSFHRPCSFHREFGNRQTSIGTPNLLRKLQGGHARVLCTVLVAYQLDGSSPNLQPLSIDGRCSALTWCCSRSRNRGSRLRRAELTPKGCIDRSINL